MHVLIIDDEAALRQILVNTVSRAGYTTDTAECVRDAAAKLVRGDVDVALCDIRMPDGDGVDLVRSMRAAGIDTQFIMVTAFASMETAVEALRAGATDYMVKPISNEDLLHRLGNIDALRGLKAENRALRRLVGGEQGVFHFDAPKMAEVERLVARVAVTDSTVLVTGESGTGKGVVARSIHEQSPRSEAPFIPINCGAIPENLLESELFGHTKGAFTGAAADKQGLLLAASGGTLFLDEITEMSPSMQVKLLRVIQEREVLPLGGTTAVKVDVRFVAATNRDVLEMVKRGEFRQDLYFRLNVVNLHIPPLSRRREDIPLLAYHFLRKCAARMGKPVSEIAAEPLDILKAYDFPGNVRELENIIERGVAIANGDTIETAYLPDDLRELSIRTFRKKEGRLPSLEEQERDYIRWVLAEAGGNQTLAAQILGIDRVSLWRKLKRYQLETLE